MSGFYIYVGWELLSAVSELYIYVVWESLTAVSGLYICLVQESLAVLSGFYIYVGWDSLAAVFGLYVYVPRAFVYSRFRGVSSMCQCNNLIVNTRVFVHASPTGVC